MAPMRRETFWAACWSFQKEESWVCSSSSLRSFSRRSMSKIPPDLVDVRRQALGLAHEIVVLHEVSYSLRPGNRCPFTSSLKYLSVMVAMKSRTFSASANRSM